MIGRQPNLLARISSRIADNDSYEEPDRTPSPAVGLSHSMASGSNDVGPSRSRPTLLQALGGHDIEMSEPQEASFLNGGFDQSVSLGMAADDFSTAPIAMPLSTFKPTARVAVSTPANRNISSSKPQQASTSSGVSKTTVQPSASRLTASPTSASPKATPRTTQVSNPYIVVPSPTGTHLASQTPPSSIGAASTNSMVICPPDQEDPSLMTLRGLQVRLMSTLANLSPVNTSDALRLANSAKEQCSAVMTVAHRSHALARQALAAAQESMDAAQECVEAAQSIQLRVDEAVVAVQTISSGLGLVGGQEREWNDHLKSMQGDLHQLARWASEREVQDAKRQREAEEREKQLDQQKIALASIPRHIDPAPTISVTADSNLVSSKTFIGHSITVLSTHALSVEDEADAATRAWKQSMKEANERKRHAEEEVHRKRDDELRLEREHKKAQEDAAARQVAFENARAERERAEEEERVRRQEAAQEVQKRREQIQKQQEEVRRFNLSQQKQKEEVDRKLTEERERARREEEEKEARMLAQERKRREQEEQQRLTAKSQEDADAKRREEQERVCRRNLDDMHASAGQVTNLPQSLAKHKGPTNGIIPSTSTSTALPLNTNSSASPNVASSQPLRRQDTGNSVSVDTSRSEGLGDVVPISVLSRSSASPLSAMGSTVANRAPLPTRQPPVGHTARYGASSTRDNTRVHDLPKIQNDGKSNHLPDTGGQVFNGPAFRQSYTRGSPVLPGVVADRPPTPSTQPPKGILGAPDEIATHSEGTDIGNVPLLPLSQITPVSPETRRVNIRRIMLSRSASNGPVIKQEPDEQTPFIKEEESSEPVMLEKRKANWVSQDLAIKKSGIKVGPSGSKSKTTPQPSPNAPAVPNVSPPPPYSGLSVIPAQIDVSTPPANEQPIVPTNSTRSKHPSMNKPSDTLFSASSLINGTVNPLAPQVGSASTAQRASPNVLLAGRGAGGSTAPPQSSALPSITITHAVTPVKPAQDNLGPDSSTTGDWSQLMALHRDIREQSLNNVDQRGGPADSRVYDRYSPSPPRSPQYSPRSPNLSPSPSPPLGYQGVPRNSQLLYKPSPPRQRLPPSYKGRNNSPGLSRPRPSGSRGASPTFRARSPRSLEYRRSVSRELVPPPIVGQKRLRDDEQGAPPPRRSRYREHARPSEQITTRHSYQDEWSRAADYGRSPSPESLQIPLALRMDSGPSTDTAPRPNINKRPPPNNYRPNYNRPSHGDDSHRPPRYNTRNDENDSRPGLLSRFTDSAPLPPPGQGYQYASGPTRSRPPRPSGRGGGRGGHGLEHRISSNSQSLFNRLQNEA